MFNLNFCPCISLCYGVCSLFHWIFRPNCITTVTLSGALEPKNPMTQQAKYQNIGRIHRRQVFFIHFCEQKFKFNFFQHFIQISGFYFSDKVSYFQWSLVMWHQCIQHKAQRSRVTYGMQITYPFLLTWVNKSGRLGRYLQKVPIKSCHLFLVIVRSCWDHACLDEIIYLINFSR